MHGIKKIYKYVAVILITFVVTLSLSSTAQKNQTSNKDSQIIKKVENLKLFDEILKITKNNYVEKISEKKLYESAFDGMLSSLDPHSGFLNESDFKEINVQTKGEFGGVGIEITMDKGLIKVISPIDDTPAYRAGIKALDYITMIDDESVRGMNINQAVKKIRGPKGTKVKLTILREGENKPKHFMVARDTIQIVSVKSSVKANGIAYLRITSFSKQTAVNLESQLRKIKSKLGKNLKGVVLDLRNNPGGLLDQAISVSELFLDGGIVVSTKGRAQNTSDIFYADSGDIIKNVPMAILVNAGSASASEIVAGALQDHKRAVVLGTKSFGKGSVQTIIPLGDKVALRLTTSRYYTPLGTAIQAKGINPDVIVKQAKLEESDNNRYSEANLRGHLNNEQTNKGSKKEIEDLDKIYKDDYQLARAIDLLHALNVIKR